jgi:hypothetical protein
MHIYKKATWTHREHYTNTCSLYIDSIHTLTQHSKAFLNWPFTGMKRSRILNFKGYLQIEKGQKWTRKIKNVCFVENFVILFDESSTHVTHHNIYSCLNHILQFCPIYLTVFDTAFQLWSNWCTGKVIQQCCGSGSGIRCSFYPWIRDSGIPIYF